MKQRPLRFAIERPVEYRFTDARGSTRLPGRTVNISSTGVLMRTDQRIGVGRRLELIVRMAQLMPGGPEVDLRILGTTVRSGDGWVAVEARKHQILSRRDEAAEFRRLPGILRGSGNIPGRMQNPAV